MSVQIKGVGTIGGIDQGLNVVGVITASSLVGTGVSVVGVITATSFSGSGANLTSLPSQVTINNASGNRVITSDGGTTLNGEANLTFSSDVLQVSSTTQGLGAKFVNTANEYTNLQFSAARTSADNALGIINAKWNNNHEVAAIYLQAGDDTTNKDDGQIKFYTAAASGSIAERFHIKNNGDVSVTDGNLVIGTAGHGIDFSASGNAGGMASELLDDYEQGTWTPSLNVSATYSSQVGIYVKIGRLVYVQWAMAFTNLSGTGYPYVGGLPFNCYTSGSNPIPNIRSQDAQPIQLRQQPSTSYGNGDKIYVRGYDSNGNAWQPAGGTFWNNGNFNGTMTYYTTS